MGEFFLREGLGSVPRSKFAYAGSQAL
jgi:hypothetical protein